MAKLFSTFWDDENFVGKIKFKLFFFRVHWLSETTSWFQSCFSPEMDGTGPIWFVPFICRWVETACKETHQNRFMFFLNVFFVQEFYCPKNHWSRGDFCPKKQVSGVRCPPVYWGPSILEGTEWLGQSVETSFSFKVLNNKLISDQIIATSHDLTPNGCLIREIPLFQGNLGWWNIIPFGQWYVLGDNPPEPRMQSWEKWVGLKLGIRMILKIRVMILVVIITGKGGQPNWYVTTKPQGSDQLTKCWTTSSNVMAYSSSRKHGSGKWGANGRCVACLQMGNFHQFSTEPWLWEEG